MLKIRVLLALSVFIAAAATAHSQPTVTTEKRALLIGCTVYQKCPGCPELSGPLNDIPLLARALNERFGFEEKDVTRLGGWPDDPSQRPTYANIVAGFEKLIKDAKPGMQIVILMSGHGAQVPSPDSQLDPLDPKNPEPDGLDEIFLPADVEAWSKDGLVNAIRDDQIGDWLDQLKAKGASVWILFDCCHSGTLSRGNSPAGETARSTSPDSLGIPMDKVTAARNRARAVADGSAGKKPAGELEINHQDDKAVGSVTAFFAAQPFEEAPEVYRPANAPRKPENKFGLLTYLVVQALQQQSGKHSITYRELSHAVVTRYRAERGSNGPTPLFDGQLDREVLGLKEWPARGQLRLERFENELRIPGGALRGLTIGTVLRVVSPGADLKEPKGLGHVRVTYVTPAAAVVEPCEFQGAPAPDAKSLPGLAPCVVVSQDLGDMRIAVRLKESPHKDLASLNALLNKAAGGVAAEEGSFLVIAQKGDSASWELRAVTPGEAAAEFNFKLDQAAVVLLKSVDMPSNTTADAAGKGTSTAMRVLRVYPVDDSTAMAAALKEDFRKISTWQNIWRVANATGGELSDPAIKLDVALIKGKDDRSAGEPLTGGSLSAGQPIEIRVKNDSIDDQWVTLLFLGSDFKITVLASGGVKEGQSLRPFRGRITDKSVGVEGVVVLAIPMPRHKAEPDFRFLEQAALGKSLTGTRGGIKAPRTPFGMLMESASAGKRTRGAEPQAPDNPEIQTRSWIALPAGKS